MHTFTRIPAILAALLCLVHTANAQTATWKGTNGNTWTDPANWVEGVLPTASSSVVINSCSDNNCPALSADVNIANLTINSGGGIHLQQYNLVVSAATSIGYATVNSSGGAIRTADFSYLYRNNFKGAITLERTGAGQNYWQGGNVFNGPVTLRSGTASWQVRTGNIEGDVFNEDVVIYGYGGHSFSFGYHRYFTLPTICKKNLTMYAYTGGGLATVRCEGNVTINVLGGGAQLDKGEYLGSVFLNILTPPVNSNYGSAICVGNNGMNCTFYGPVVVTNTSTQNGWYTRMDMHFGLGGGSCTFAPTASLSVSEQGFRRANLVLEKCTFQSTVRSLLNLSSGGTTEAYTSALVINTGTSFAGPLQIKAPGILLNGGTFNQDVTITKTGAGINNSTGGNVFRKKLTITNEAGANSPMNLATQYDDLMQQ